MFQKVQDELQVLAQTIQTTTIIHKTNKTKATSNLQKKNTGTKAGGCQGLPGSWAALPLPGFPPKWSPRDHPWTPDPPGRVLCRLRPFRQVIAIFSTAETPLRSLVTKVSKVVFFWNKISYEYTVSTKNSMSNNEHFNLFFARIRGMGFFPKTTNDNESKKNKSTKTLTDFSQILQTPEFFTDFYGFLHLKPPCFRHTHPFQHTPPNPFQSPHASRTPCGSRPPARGQSPAPQLVRDTYPVQRFQRLPCWGCWLFKHLRASKKHPFLTPGSLFYGVFMFVSRGSCRMIFYKSLDPLTREWNFIHTPTFGSITLAMYLFRMLRPSSVRLSWTHSHGLLAL